MLSNYLPTMVALICLVSAGCGGRDLRGSWSPSGDGKTYLAVDDDNGGQCGPIKVDGQVWPHKIGEAGQVKPGTHTIESCGEMKFDICPGVVYRFNYWGP
jgi:hypothetical protein